MFMVPDWCREKKFYFLWGNHFAYRCCEGAQNLAAERWFVWRGFLRGLRFDMLTQVEGWGLTRCIMRSDCSCKVAAWGSWGTSLWSGEIVKLSLKCCKYKYLWVGIKPPSLNLAKHQVCSSFLAARISHYHELMTNTHFVLSHPHSEGNISLSSCVLQKVPFPLHHSLFQRCIRYLSMNQPMVC